jgi:hypothetical protein
MSTEQQNTQVVEPVAADLSKVENLLEDIKKSVEPAVEDNTAEILAKSADTLLQDNKKLVEGVTGRFSGVEAKLDNMDVMMDKIIKSIANIEARVDAMFKTPSAPKAVVAEQTPAELQPIQKSISYSDVVSKATAALAANPSNDQAMRIKLGIAQLDAGVSPEAIAKSLNLL